MFALSSLRLPTIPDHPLARLIVSALAYFLLGKLGLFFALPAGLVSAFWPAAGAAAALCSLWGWPAAVGVFLGAFFNNFTTGAFGSSIFAIPDSAVMLPSFAATSLGAALQGALGGSILLRLRQVLQQEELSLGYFFRVLLLAGPVSCCVSATIAAFALEWVGSGDSAQALHLWLAWWLGDATGVMLFVPVMVLHSLKRRELSSAYQRMRSPWGLLLLVMLPAGLFAAFAGRQQVEESHRGFLVQTERLRSDVQGALSSVATKLQALNGLYGASGEVSVRSFQTFADGLLRGSPELLGLAYARAVDDADRTAVERALSADYGRRIVFKESGTQSAPVAPRRSIYWPVLRAAPAARQSLLGFDFAADVQRMAAIQKLPLGGIASSERLIAHAVGSSQLPTALLMLGTARPKGAVVAAVDIDALVGGGDAAKALRSLGVSLRLENDQQQALAWFRPATFASEEFRTRFAAQYLIEVGSSTWRLSVKTPHGVAPFMAEPGWWLWQFLPQLMGVLIGMLLAHDAGRENALLALEQQGSTLFGHTPDASKPSHLAAPEPAPVAPTIKRYDYLIEEGWRLGVFEPRYEPVIELASGRMVGVEALLRWPQAPTGLITPDIIEWAERKGLIAELDTLMLCKALDDLSAWSLARNTPFTLAVNVSATEMLQGHWAQRVIDALDHAKLSGRRLCLEITEGVLLKSDSTVLSQLARLRAMGVKVALDDFGTGYSSIGYLRQLPVDRIKLDRMFISGLVTDLKAKEIVRSVVRLAGSLEVEVVAEGVEDAVTAETLIQLGCPLAQGWLFSKAVRGDTVGRWLAAGLPLYPDHSFDLGGDEATPEPPPRAASSSG